MIENNSSSRPIYTQPTALMEAVLAISRQNGIEAIAHEASKYVVEMLQVDFCEFSEVVENGVVSIAEFSASGDRVEYDKGLIYKFTDYPLTEKVIREAKAVQVRVDDPDADPAEVAMMKKFESYAMLMIPLIAENRVIGLVEVVDDYQARDFDENEIAFVQLLLNYVGILIERAYLLEGSQKRAVELETLHRVGLALTAALDLESVFQAVLHSLLELSDDILDAHVFLYKNGQLELGCSSFGDEEEDQEWPPPRKDGLTITTARSGKTIVIEDASRDKRVQLWPREIQAQAFVFLPMKMWKNVIGVIRMGYKTPQKFNPGTLKVLEMLSDQAALAVDNAQLHQEMINQAMTDSLTGVANRRAFELRLEEEVQRATRYEKEFCLVFMDLDGFKRVNDVFGHLVGDRILKQVASCLQNSTRESDLLARWGGDEFVLLAPETNYQDGLVIASKLTNGLNECTLNLRTETGVMRLGISMGVVSFPYQASTAEGLIQVGDALLYQNKFRKNPDFE